MFGRVIAKKFILREWKLEAVVGYDLWWNEMANMLHVIRLRLCEEDRGNVFDKIWCACTEISLGEVLMYYMYCKGCSAVLL